ncbi:MAG TPA: peptidoglycan-binding protein [Clostridiales bacterium UBA8153]|nr:peptidoglycan-binding protein [Clostridiales bacterium UBA8153]
MGSNRAYRWTTWVVAVLLVVAPAPLHLAPPAGYGNGAMRTIGAYGVAVAATAHRPATGASVPSPGQTAGAKVYVVRPGDTLWDIAAAHGITLAGLREANRIFTHLIHPGQVLAIPVAAARPGGGFYHVVRAGDTLYYLAGLYATTIRALRQANDLWTDHLSIGATLIIPRTAGNPARVTRYTLEELDLLARLVQAEAGGEPFTGQVAVAASVLNRVRDRRYPNTIGEVIYQVIAGVHQYSPVRNGRIYRAAGRSALRAAREALYGADPSLGANGFFNPEKTNDRWVRRQPVTVVIGNHVFFRH